MTRREDQNWESHHKKWKKGGKSKRAYCQENGLSYWAFSYRSKKLNRKNKTCSTQFIEVPISKETAPSINNPAALVLVTRNKYRIEINNGFNPEHLTTLLKTLEAENHVLSYPAR